jgi:protein-S-isoprenylcysteine O-methyltransferase Ste14
MRMDTQVADKKEKLLIGFMWLMGVPTALVGLGYLFPGPLQLAMFGAQASEPLGELMMRGWAGLIGLTGVLMIIGARSPALRLPFLTIAAVSKTLFITMLLVWGEAFVATVAPALVLDSVVVLVALTKLPVKKLYPPHYLVLGLVVILLGDRAVSLPLLPDLLASILGALLLLAGLALTVSAARLFSKAKTGIVPFSESTTLVVDGAYRFTRNPMYLGMFAVLFGVSLLVNSALGIAVFIAFFWVIRTRFVLQEEAMMLEVYGEQYTEFKSKVRRWI